MNDVMILNEAVRLVEEGLSVTRPVDGRSMLPFIIGGRESVILTKPDGIVCGDVVLAWIAGSRFVLHRVIAIDGDKVTLMGDGNLQGVERCTFADVKAKATHAISSRGRRRYLYTPWRVKASRLWLRLRPIRRYLLKIYKIMIHI